MADDSPPLLELRPLSARPKAGDGSYEIRWQVDNLSSEPASLLESWLPHSRFFGPRRMIRPPLALPAQGSRSIRRSVRLPSEPHLVVENAFLNLRVLYRGQPWRVLVRMRVERRAPNSVSVTVEAITAHRVGFAGGAEEEQQ